MAVAIENSQFNGYTGGATNRTFSYTTGSGVNNEGLLLVAVATASNYDPATYTVTFNGLPLNLVTSVRSSASILVSDVGLYMLQNPPVGTFNVSVTSTTSEVIGVITVSFTGVDFEAPIEASNTASGAFTVNPSVSVTTLKDNSLVVDFVSVSAETDPMTVGSGQTQLQQGSHNSGLGQSVMGASYELKATPGAVSMDWTTVSPNGDWASIAVSVRAAGARMKMIGVSKMIFS